MGTAGTLLGVGAIGKFLLPMLPALGALGLGAGGSALMMKAATGEATGEPINPTGSAAGMNTDQRTERLQNIEDGGAMKEAAKGINMPSFMGLNKGGQVPGQGHTDTVPAMLTPGEFVVNKKSVETWGVNTFEVMNNNLEPTTYQHDVKQLNKSMDKKVVYVPIIRNNNHTTTIRRRGLR